MLRKFLFPIATISFFLFSCTEEDTTPKIVTIEPLAGNYNDEITLNGVNFDQTLSNNSVRFGSELATIVSGSNTQLVVKVPANAPTGKISISTDNGSSMSSQVFTVTAGSWKAKANASTVLSSGSSSIMLINDVAYILKGKTNPTNGDPATLLKYDGSVWTTKTIYDADVNGVFWNSWGTPGGKGYVLEGNYKLMEYDPQTDSWSQKASPLTIASPIAGFSIGELGYVLFSTEIKVYDPANNSWATKSTNYADLTITNPLFVSSGIKAYLACEEGIYQLDTVSGNWTLLTENPDFRPGFHAGFFLYANSQLLLGSTGSEFNETWVYDISTNKWTQKGKFPLARHGAVSFTIADQFYVGMGSEAVGPSIVRSDLYMYMAN